MRSQNPFALVTLAQLAENEAGKDAAQRYETKLRLIRLLFAHGYSKASIRNLLTFIDWILQLPVELEQRLRLTLRETATEETMQYIPSWERLAKAEGIEEGREEGREEGLLVAVRTVLQSRFDTVPEDVMQAAAELDEAQLQALLAFASVARTTEDIQAHIADM